MSPWGKFYLENMSYNSTWFVVFQSWRMWGILDVIFERWAPVNTSMWFKIERHLDIVESYLTLPGDLFNDPKTRGW